jgi:hypothetical protein
MMKECGKGRENNKRKTEDDEGIGQGKGEYEVGARRRTGRTEGRERRDT